MSHREGRIIHDADSHIIEGRGWLESYASEYVRDNWPAELPAPIISSFNAESLAASHKILPEIEHAIIWDELPANWQDEVESLKADVVHLDAKLLNEDQCKSVINSGSSVRCFTVNDASRAEELFDWGVEAIFTDYPERMQQRTML